GGVRARGRPAAAHRVEDVERKAASAFVARPLGKRIAENEEEPLAAGLHRLLGSPRRGRRGAQRLPECAAQSQDETRTEQDRGAEGEERRRIPEPDASRA